MSEMEKRALQWRSALLEGVGVLLGILIAFGIDAAWAEYDTGEWITRRRPVQHNS